MPNCVQFLSVPSSFVCRWKYNKLHVDFLIDRFTTHQKILFTFRFYLYFISFSTSHKLNSNIILYTLYTVGLKKSSTNFHFTTIIRPFSINCRPSFIFVACHCYFYRTDINYGTKLMMLLSLIMAILSFCTSCFLHLRQKLQYTQQKI